jgi:hypothetical protein
MGDGNIDSTVKSAKIELKEETGYFAQNWISPGSFLPSPGWTNEWILPTIMNLADLKRASKFMLTFLIWEELMYLVKRISTWSRNSSYFEVYDTVGTMTEKLGV